MGLMQKEVAELIGISRGHYIDFEVGYVDYYPKEIVDKLAELYGVPVDDLLDDYNRFLYKGQGKMIREYRESLGLKKKPFARLMGISPNLLRAWEDHQKRMKHQFLEQVFQRENKSIRKAGEGALIGLLTCFLFCGCDNRTQQLRLLIGWTI
mgnify:CR=1 FL=1